MVQIIARYCWAWLIMLLQASLKVATLFKYAAIFPSDGGKVDWPSAHEAAWL